MPANPGAPLSGGGARFGDLRDIRHVVILMQENRSFDHYFGTLAGVRGFGDRAVIRLPGGQPAWRQPAAGLVGAGDDPDRANSAQYPWRLSAGRFEGAQPPTSAVGAQNYAGTDHSWRSQHLAWNGGLMDAWQHAKDGPTTMGYLTRADIPFYYALADAYTIGDAYHCSVLAATGPNRTYLWSGTINADQRHGAFIAHAAADYLGDFLPWECYPVTLERAGVSWKIYQGSDNYGDNGAQYFATLAELDPAQGGTAPAPGGSAYYDNGLAVVDEPLDYASGNAANLADAIEADVRAGTLPQVCWVVTNQRYSEHPNGAPTDGEYYVGRVLRALNADPGVLDSALVIINYDENDGQFDHVPPPAAPPGTADEYCPDPALAVPLPAGLGFRVPLLLISPWTRGGWVTSEVADHTSVLQFLERWTSAIGRPANCPHISAWRRAVCGDLLSAFDFEHPVYGLPELPFVAAPIGDAHEYHPRPADNAMPVQEPGRRPARPLPVQPNANLRGFTIADSGLVTADLELSNDGAHVRKASHFAVYDNTLAASPALAGYPAGFPGQYTVADVATSAVGPVSASGGYDITVVGPNRFLRRFAGRLAGAGAATRVTADYYAGQRETPPTLTLTFANAKAGSGAAAAGDANANAESDADAGDLTFLVTPNNYGADAAKYRVGPGEQAVHRLDPVATSDGWYDLTVTIDGDDSWSQRYTGHLETGEPSVTG